LSNPSSQHIPVVGLDIGGTKLLAVLMSPDANILARCQIPTPKGNQAVTAAVIDVLVQLLKSTRAGQPLPRAIAIGAPGFVDSKAGVMVKADNLDVEDLPLTAPVEKYFNLPTRLYHDVRSAALGEAQFGAARGYHDFAYLNLGTGVAVGLFLDGKIYRGSVGRAGELGQTCLQSCHRSPDCSPETRLEAQASGPALARKAIAALATGEPSILNTLVQHNFERITPEIIGQAGQMGDALALRLIAEVADVLGIAIAAMIDLLDLECIVIGGGLASLGEILINPVRTALQKYGNEEYVKSVPILGTRLGADTGAIGAAASYLLEERSC
jgi:predicted NBD/HSP70 family sugar kinase